MRKSYISVILIIIGMLSVAADKVKTSSVYEWQNLTVSKTSTGEERIILSGPTQTLAMFSIKAITLKSGLSLPEYFVGMGMDNLLIIKDGQAEITVNKEVRELREGSIVVASQGDKVKIINLQNKNLTFYTFLFKPYKPSGELNKNSKINPLMKDWNSFEFTPTANGGGRVIMRQPTSALKELEIHTTLLNEGLPSHAAHTHPDEEIILSRFGVVEETINDKPFKLGPGSVIFLSNNDSHGIRNAGAGKCEYYAIRWLTYPVISEAGK